jgi:hypothetical protein
MSGSEKTRLSDLPRGELEALTERLPAENAELEQAVAKLGAAIAQLRGLKGRPKLKPSGLEPGIEPKSGPASGGRGGTSQQRQRRAIDEDRILPEADLPAGSRFKGYEDYVLPDLVLRPRVVRLRRERWLTPDGRSVTAPLPADGVGHFGPQLRRFVLIQYHQGQVTVRRLVAQLQSFGIRISKRQVLRLLNEGQDSFRAKARAVLRAGLATAAWISVDDTGSRHRHQNGVCTQVGNDHFAAFASTASKSRLNFLEVLRAGHGEYVINAEALAYMRRRALAGPVIARLATHPRRCFVDEAAWTRHLGRLGITKLAVTPDPVRLASEGALWGSITVHGLLPDTVIVSDEAGQFALDRHALCRVGGAVASPAPHRPGRADFAGAALRVPASGSSGERFARRGVAMDDPGWRPRMALEERVEALPSEGALAIPPRQPFLPDPHHAVGIPPQSSTVAACNQCPLGCPGFCPSYRKGSPDGGRGTRLRRLVNAARIAGWFQ